MSDETAPASVPEWGGDRRQGDRRGGFRDRRRPPPPWRRPWALIAYGAVGTLALLLVLLTALRQRREPVPVVSEGASATAGGAPAAGPPVPVEPGPAEAAYSAADFERLIAEGDAAVGRRVRAVLLCEPIVPIALRPREPAPRQLAALADSAGRVPGARCRWAQEGDMPGEEFLLVVPPSLAEAFARSPTVRVQFVERRRVHAELIWLGRLPALSLRTVGILDRVLR